MIKISNVIEEIIQHDEVAKEALKLNILNMSAYANRVKPSIESRLYKPVTQGAIVVALSRMRESLQDFPDFYPQVTIENISVKSPLVEFSFEKTQQTVHLAAHLHVPHLSEDAFFTVTQGVHEITIICPKQTSALIRNHFVTKPKGFYDNLASVTVKFIEKDYVEVPNMIFSLVSTLAVKRINIIEIVSTFTELSFIVRDRDLQSTVNALSPLFRKTSS